MDRNSGRTHALRAVIELRKRIVSGEFSGGTRLFEVSMAEELSISRTPVREAMSRLAEEGLLDRAAGGGFIVRSFSMDDVMDAIELRGVLEGTAARLAAERGADAEGLSRIQATVAALDSCFGANPGDVDFETYSELNATFHGQLAELCGSSLLRREIERATRLPFASPSAFLPDKANLVAFRRSLHVAQDQHREIVLAIAGREGARAEALTREHTRTARRNLEYVMIEDRSLLHAVPGLALVAG